MLCQPAAALQAGGQALPRVQRNPTPRLRLVNSLGAPGTTWLLPSSAVRPCLRRPPPLRLLHGCSRAPVPGLLQPCCAATPKWVVDKAVEALKEEHGKPTDREVAAAAAAALAATASSLHQSKTEVRMRCRDFMNGNELLEISGTHPQCFPFHLWAAFQTCMITGTAL